MSPPTVQFIPSNGGTFLPTDISGCVGWFDASDSSTITISTGVSDWSNRGTDAGITYAQLDTTQQPAYTNTLNALNVISFDGYNDEFDGALSSGLSSVSLFIVASTTDTAFNYINVGGGRYSDIAQSGSSSTALSSGFGTPTRYLTGNTTSWTTRNDVYLALTAGAHIYEAIGCDLSLWTGYTLGGVFKMLGDIAEVIFYDSSLGSTDREKVEGYLAHKWGLTAGLPVSHPYKSSAP